MSYRYPHADDSDEDGFGQSLQAAQPGSSQSQSQPQRSQPNIADDSDADDVFEDPEAPQDEEDEEDEYHDAEQSFTIHALNEDAEDSEDETYDDDEEEEEEEEEEDDDEEQQEAEATAGGTGAARIITMEGLGRILVSGLSRGQLVALLRNRGLFDDDDGGDELYGRRRRREAPDPNRFPKIPSDEGRALMDSGAFGSTDRRLPTSTRKQLARRVLDRELGIDNNRINQNAMAQSMIPSSEVDMIIKYRAPVYCGQFSQDGNFFYACVKDFKVRMYDTSNPYNWRYYKTVSFNWGQWTLTDAHLSPDNKWLAYTSLQSHVAFAPTDPNDKGDPYQLDLGAAPNTGGLMSRRNNFAIWSVRFSGDGRELIAGNNICSIIVYDIESRQVLHNIQGHEDDVNAVAFADPKDPHIIYSGSDDQVIKVWDRRSMGDRREAGAFVGHVEGLTYIDSKGDGRYILSNGKDQTMKLWDLRMAMSTHTYQELNPRRHTAHTSYDYRMEDYDPDDWFPHPNDNSIVTFRGHKVLGTLIRCHFSPPGSTDSRYVYSGSHDGKVYIWNMDATLAGTVDVGGSTRFIGTGSGGMPWRRGVAEQWNCCVREPYWHPNAPILAASSWGGYDMSYGSVSVHSWNENKEDDADPPMGHRVNDHLAAEELG